MGCAVTLVRLPDWEARLAPVIAAAQAARFAWGEHDCCVFAADCVQALTGVDLLAPVRGRYRSAYTAARLVTAEGGLQAAVSRVLGAEPHEDFAHARRGDLVAIEMPEACAFRHALGVVVGSSALVPLEIGLQRVAQGDWCRVWSVG